MVIVMTVVRVPIIALIAAVLRMTQDDYRRDLLAVSALLKGHRQIVVQIVWCAGKPTVAPGTAGGNPAITRK